jgi:NAD(P)-dependent dehydrogenase (short-subunit alcohol dehydrogenase family)
VILATRSRDKGEQAAARIRSKGGNAMFVHPLDLSSFESVREFARVIRERYPTIHCLVNNAGINTPGLISEDHLDLLFQSNFLGHYLLTAELWDVLDKNNRARIINVSSVMHHFCGNFDIENIDFWKRVASPIDSNKQHGVTKHYTYSLSKLAAILFSMELNQRYGDQVRSIAVNPGAVYVFLSQSRLSNTLKCFIHSSSIFFFFSFQKFRNLETLSKITPLLFSRNISERNKRVLHIGGSGRG